FSRLVVRLRRLGKSARRRARRVGGGDVGAALLRIAGGRPYPGARAGARGPAVDAPVEDLLELGIGRREIRGIRLGARRLRRIARLLRFLPRLRGRRRGILRALLVVVGSHRANMGGVSRGGKGGQDAVDTLGNPLPLRERVVDPSATRIDGVRGCQRALALPPPP